MKIAVYAGSFDPITNGHLWMIEQGVNLFDQLVVAIGTNPDKRYTFSLEERLNLIEQTVNGLPNVRIDHFVNQFLVHYAKAVGAGYILRGIRSEGDYEYERVLRHLNNDQRPEITTVFLMPPRAIAEVSSSLVKGFVGPEGWETIVQQYVPPAVFHCFLKKFGPPLS